MTVNNAYISAIEYVLPDRRITNADLEKAHPEWQLSQVVHRSGVETRYWSPPEETSLDLAERACRKLFANTGISPAQIDVLLFCTQTPDYIMPPNAPLLQHRLGLPTSVAAMDYNLACSGFIYGLFLAKSLIASGMGKHILLVTAEQYSRLFSPEDRGPATLFGDGAAVSYITGGKPGLGTFVTGTDGDGADHFAIPAGGARKPSSPDTQSLIEYAPGSKRSPEHIHMNGMAVLDFVKKQIPPLVAATIDKNRLSPNDIDLYVFHQASKVTLDALFRLLRIPPEKQFSNIRDIGNTVSPSIPIALKDAATGGKLGAGNKVLLAGFGVGLSWGGTVIDWLPDHI